MSYFCCIIFFYFSIKFQPPIRKPLKCIQMLKNVRKVRPALRPSRQFSRKASWEKYAWLEHAYKIQKMSGKYGRPCVRSGCFPGGPLGENPPVSLKVHTKFKKCLESLVGSPSAQAVFLKGIFGKIRLAWKFIQKSKHQRMSRKSGQLRVRPCSFPEKPLGESPPG